MKFKYGLIWYGMVWYGMKIFYPYLYSYGMVWIEFFFVDMVWYGLKKNDMDSTLPNRRSLSMEVGGIDK